MAPHITTQRVLRVPATVMPHEPCAPLITSRRYDPDCLRVIAFAVLIFFHSAIIFVPSGIPNIHNSESSAALQWFVQISHHFRLALLFCLSAFTCSSAAPFSAQAREVGECAS